MQQESRERVLGAVFQHPGCSLADLAELRLDLDRSTILRHLQSLVQQGAIFRQGDGRKARYSPRERLDIAWSTDLNGVWSRMRWGTGPPFDLRFPLAGRISDDHGRGTTLRFLQALEDRGLHSVRAAHRLALEAGAWPERLPESDRVAYRRFLESPKFDLGPTIIAFGSCVRGEARADSDIDLLYVAPTMPPGLQNFSRGGRKVIVPSVDFEESVRDLTAEVNLGSTRPLDLVFTEEEDLLDLNPGLLRAVAREGRTIYGRSNNPSYFVEAWPTLTVNK